MTAADAPATVPATAPPPARTPWRRAAHIGRRAWRMELGVYRSIFRFAFRRPRVPAGASAFRYHAPVMTILIVFIALSAVEIPIIDLIVHRWPPVRIPLLVLGIWGVTWMLGLLLGYLTRPHAVGPAGIIVRQGTELDLVLPWEVIHAVERSPQRVERLPGEKRRPAVVDEQGARTYAARIANETNLRIVLERPFDVRLPHGDDRIEAVRLWVDDLDGFMAAVRAHIP